MILIGLMRLVTHLGLALLQRVIRSGRFVFGALILLYIFIFALDSDRGYAALKDVRAEVVAAQTKLDTVKAQREATERKVIALRPTSLDPDLLDEQTRKTLGYKKPDEIVIYGK